MTHPDATVASLEEALRHAVFIALKSPAAQPFLDGMHLYGVDLFIEAMGAQGVSAQERTAIAMMLGRTIWNHLPHPAHDFQPLRLPDPGRNDPCPCGSGKKFKQCCATYGIPAMPLETDGMLQIVLEFLPKKALADFPRKRFAPELLAGIGEMWLRNGKGELTLALLEPFFAAPETLDARHSGAFDVLMNAYLELGKPRKRKQLLELCLSAADRHLRATALQRQCAVRFDEGDHAGAWQSFHAALRENPDDPSHALLELTLLNAEGNPEMMRERARFWLLRLQKRPDAAEWADIAEVLRATMENPANLSNGFVADVAPDFMELAATLRDLPPPSHFPKLKVLDDGSAIWPEERAKWLEEWLNLDGDLADDLRWLAKHPKAWDSMDVLAGLVDDVLESGLPLEWLDENLLGVLLKRVHAVFTGVWAATPGQPQRFEWGWQDNRHVLHLLIERLQWLARQRNDEECIAAGAELLRLNPGDNHAIRNNLSGLFLATGRYAEAAELHTRYPDDFATLSFDRALALFGLDRKGEALSALADAVKNHPKVLKMLVAEKPRQPREDQYGVKVGGDYEAWLYREARRWQWEKTGALDWARQYAKVKH
ncbi:MAG: SEC-C domain-containing protein [Sulfuricella sp.]|nr:SEC-C domain-containing protein [Sulfuricella sp.]